MRRENAVDLLLAIGAGNGGFDETDVATWLTERLQPLNSALRAPPNVDIEDVPVEPSRHGGSTQGIVLHPATRAH